MEPPEPDARGPWEPLSPAGCLQSWWGATPELGCGGQRAPRQLSWGGLAVLTRPRSKTAWRHFSKNTEALPKEGGPARLSVSQGPSGRWGGVWGPVVEAGGAQQLPLPIKAHCCLGGPGTSGRVRMLRRRWVGSRHQQVRGRGASVPLNKGSHARGWAAVSPPTPGWRGVTLLCPCLRLAEGQPTSAPWDPGRAADQDKAGESRGLAGVAGGAMEQQHPAVQPCSFRRPVDSCLGWKRWLGRALCQRAGAVGGRLPSASQQMPQLELRVCFCAPSLHQCSLPSRGALRPEPSVTLRMVRGPGSWALPRREAPGRWVSLAPPNMSFTRCRGSWL